MHTCGCVVPILIIHPHICWCELLSSELLNDADAWLAKPASPAKVSRGGRQQCQRFCTKQKVLECQPLKCRASLSLNGSVCISKSNSMCQGFSSSSCLFMVPVQNHERHSFRYCWRTFRHIWKVVAHLHHCGSASRVLDTKQISNDFLNKKNGLDHLPRK